MKRTPLKRKTPMRRSGFKPWGPKAREFKTRTPKGRIGNPIDTPKGYRLVAIGEKIKPGDIWFYAEYASWSSVTVTIGRKFQEGMELYATLLPRKPLRSASSKLAARRRQYAVARVAFLARPENQWCPVAAAGWLDIIFAGEDMNPKRQRATEIHHKDGREGDLLLDETKWLAVSRAGHNWIHCNPKAARLAGWLV